MERVYRNTEEIVGKMKIVPIFDGCALKLEVYLDGKRIGCVDNYNRQFSVKVMVVNNEKAALEETNGDIKELAQLIYAEAAGEYDIHNAMEAVAWVVRNRVKADESWMGGSTYHGVIHYKGQFTSVGGRLWNEASKPEALSKPKDIAAYKRALSVARGVYNGTIPDPTNGAHYFHSYKEQNYDWFGTTRANGKITPANPEQIEPFWLFKLK